MIMLAGFAGFPIMGMVMVVGVVGEGEGDFLAEEVGEGFGAADLVGAAFATDVAVEADDAGGRGHHEMQIVGDEKDGAASGLVDFFEVAVEVELALHVDALDGFVEHEQVGLAQEGAGEEGALPLAAGEGLERVV